jgi:proline iminopeptidase
MATPAAATPQVTDGLKDVNGTQLFFKTIGKGAPIFVLHGGPGGSHRYFLPGMLPLADSYQLVFYDQRGTGRSSGKLDLKAISIGQFVEDLESLRAALGYDKITLIGHSWGAVIGLFYAFKYQAHLERLILVDPRPVTNAFLAQQGETIRDRLQRLSPEDRQARSTICARPSSKQTPEERARCAKLDAALNFYDAAKALAADNTVDPNTERNAPTIQALMKQSLDQRLPEIDAGLKAIAVPTLIIHGEADPIPLGASDYIRQGIPGARMVAIKQSGHFPFIEQPEAFVAAVEEFMRG